jgi:hypothetical protein
VAFAGCRHFVYTRLVEETYEFDDRSYTALAAAGIAWQDVIYTLYDSRPKIRRHIGAVLNVAARDRQGHWLGVALIERDDNDYLVVGARYLDSDEVATVTKMLGGLQ